MKKTIAYCFLIFIFFSGACSREKSEYTFETSNPIELDESKIVLTTFPSALTEINDSILGALNSGSQLSLYNIFTGKNTANFSTANVSFDSVITTTYRKKYANKRKYIYDATVASGMSGGNSQLLNFWFSENTFYVYVNTLVEVNYDNDKEELQRFLKTANAQQLSNSTEDVNIQVMEYLEFIFVLDEQLQIKKIIPLYERARLKKDNYSPFFQKGFAVKNNQLFTPIYNSEKGISDLSGKMVCNNTFFALANYDLTNDDAVQYSLPYKTIDFNDFSVRNYFTSPFSFRDDENELLFSNGKEILNVRSEKKIFSKILLEENEWISDFRKQKNTVTMLTYKLFQKQQQSEAEKMYGSDSLGDVQIKIFQTELIATMELPLKTRTTVLITKDKVFLVEKDKEHYYFKSIHYHEN